MILTFSRNNNSLGNFISSEADIAITKKIKDAGSLMEIAVLDHIIIGSDRYYSFADDGTI